MERLLALTDQELLDVVHKTPTTDAAASLLADAEGDDSVLRDEAWTCYWRNQYSTHASFSDEQIRRIINEAELVSARSLLGEAARDDNLLPEQVDYLLARLGADEWARKQLLARRRVDRVKRHDSTIDTSVAVIREGVDYLIDSRATWALRELLPLFDRGSLLRFRKRLNNEGILTRHDRHNMKLEVTSLLEDAK